MGITFSRSGLRVYREEEQVTGCRATSSRSHPGGPAWGPLQLVPPSRVLPPNFRRGTPEGSFLVIQPRLTERALLLRKGTGYRAMWPGLSSGDMENVPDPNFWALVKVSLVLAPRVLLRPPQRPPLWGSTLVLGSDFANVPMSSQRARAPMFRQPPCCQSCGPHP